MKFIFAIHVIHDLYLFSMAFVTELEPTNLKLTNSERNMRTGLDDLKYCDKHLEYLKCGIDHTRCKKLMKLGVLITWTMSLLFVIEYNRRKTKNLLNFWMTINSSGTYVLMNGQYIVVVYYAWNRLKYLNLCLKF